MPVQLRFHTGLTGDEYVTREGWRLATLSHCPAHPRGGCGFCRHGTYARKTPPGTEVARWYCRTAGRTFSLLPDHLAARLPGTLFEIEHVVVTVEQSSSVEAAAQGLRSLDISLPSAVRWVRRRLDPVRKLLPIVVELLPQLLRGCAPTLIAWRARLACDQVLVWLRALTEVDLQALEPPLGFKPPPYARDERKSRFQQYKGHDPPAGGR
jgi:transposase-like protein